MNATAKQTNVTAINAGTTTSMPVTEATTPAETIPEKVERKRSAVQIAAKVAGTIIKLRGECTKEVARHGAKMTELSAELDAADKGLSDEVKAMVNAILEAQGK